MVAMKKVLLQWFEPYRVVDLYVLLRESALVSNEKYSGLNNYGFYMYYDEKSPKQPKYIGQSYGKSQKTLAKRIRWEVVKDGSDGGAISKFTEKCCYYHVDKQRLILKVGYIKESSETEHTPQFMNDIELALIFQMQPIMNEHGKKRYRRGSIEIVNMGDYPPFPDHFTLP
jgi:hypothetical protein